MESAPPVKDPAPPANRRPSPSALSLFFVLLSLAASGETPSATRQSTLTDPMAPAVSASLILVDSLTKRAIDRAQPPILTLVSQMAAAAAKGQPVETFIQTVVKLSRFPSATQKLALEDCLRSNWQAAQDYGLLTPENLDRMQSGKMPVATAGVFAGTKMALRSQPSDGSWARTTFRLLAASEKPAPPRDIVAVKTIQVGPQSSNWEPVPSPTPSMQPMPPHRYYPPSFAGAPPATIPPGPIKTDLFGNLLRDARSGEFIPRSDAPDPKITATPRSDGVAGVVRFIDVRPNDPIRLENLGAQRNHLHINSAEVSSGIVYSLVDPAKTMVIESHPTVEGVSGPTFVPNTTHHTVAWKDDPIPGTTEKGTLLLNLGPMKLYFVDTFAAGQGKFRLALIGNPQR